jgi:LPXTG-motif cell wall-anchored protein
MKKIILAIALFAAVSANAQSDSFFRYNNVEEQRTNSGNGEWGTMPTLVGHGYTTDMDANAPLGSGLLLLGGMAVLYARRKKSN